MQDAEVLIVPIERHTLGTIVLILVAVVGVPYLIAATASPKVLAIASIKQNLILLIVDDAKRIGQLESGPWRSYIQDLRKA